MSSYFYQYFLTVVGFATVAIVAVMLWDAVRSERKRREEQAKLDEAHMRDVEAWRAHLVEEMKPRLKHPLKIRGLADGQTILATHEPWPFPPPRPDTVAWPSPDGAEVELIRTGDGTRYTVLTPSGPPFNGASSGSSRNAADDISPVGSPDGAPPYSQH